MAENEKKDPQLNEPDNSFAWLILIVLFLLLMLLSGYGLMIIYRAFEAVFTGSIVPQKPF